MIDINLQTKNFAFSFNSLYLSIGHIVED